MISVGKFRIDFILVLIFGWVIYSFSLCVPKQRTMMMTMKTTTTSIPSITSTAMCLTVDNSITLPCTNASASTSSSTASIASSSTIPSPIGAAAPTTVASSASSVVASSTSASVVATTSSQSTSTSGGSPPSDAIDGSASYYTEWKTNKGSCGFIPSAQSYIAAVNPQFMPAKCNQCIMIYYGSKTLKVTVTDTCPSCPSNKLDLGDTAFQQLDSLDKGILQIKWAWVPC